ncbi:MAG: hypothetical protein ACRCX2_03995 [Paraclostridium sp.]
MKKIVGVFLLTFIITVFISVQGIAYADGKYGEIDFSKQRENMEALISDYNNGVYEKTYLKLGKWLSNELKVTLDNTSNIYYGELKDNKPNGLGVLQTNKYIYIGEFKKGKLDGFGIVQVGLNYYEGEFEKGHQKGKGNEFDNNNFKLNEDFTFSSEIPKYSGEWNRDRYSGKGTLYNEDGSIKYKGKFKKGDYSGEGTLYYSNGNIEYEGKFKKNKYSGKGALYNEDGTIKHKGKFKRGDIA